MTMPIPLGQVKAHLSELVHRVSSQHERIVVTVHGRPSAVLLASDDLAALEETLSILSDAATVRRLEASEAELAAGLAESGSDLRAAMDERRRRGV